jgi:hypothetical protein
MFTKCILTHPRWVGYRSFLSISLVFPSEFHSNKASKQSDLNQSDPALFNLPRLLDSCTHLDFQRLSHGRSRRLFPTCCGIASPGEQVVKKRCHRHNRTLAVAPINT